jgi:hypothetical protein
MDLMEEIGRRHFHLWTDLRAMARDDTCGLFPAASRETGLCKSGPYESLGYLHEQATGYQQGPQILRVSLL